LSFLIGVASFFTAPALNARMFNVAGAAPTLAAATTTAAFNLGNTSGPWLGGTVIDAGLGFAATAWAGAAMTAVALGLVALALRFERRGAGAAPGNSRVVVSSAASLDTGATRCGTA
ncbi:Cmx/CmrA family chloramphenicol efflux MFS transporter, partial [[Kitasatospora] papulosa]